MSWPILFTALATALITEFGDKTQLAVITLAASSKNPFSVFLGFTLGLVVVTAVGAFLGQAVVSFIPENYLRKASALLFIVMAIWMLFKGNF